MPLENVSKKKVWILILLILLVLFSIPLLKRKRDYYNIPISISRNDPRVNVDIEEKSYLFSLDTGGGVCFAMRRELLEQISGKKSLGTSSSSDFKGKDYENSLFQIDSVRVGKTRISGAPAIEESVDFLLNGSQLEPSQLSDEIKENRLRPQGRIGAPFFRLCKFWLFDFPHSSLVALKSMKKIKTLQEFSLEGFTEVALEDVKPHMVISVETEQGTKKFLLDTGATLSVMRYPTNACREYNFLTFEQFKIAGHDFGKMKFLLFEITPKMDFFDGILGMDFFLKHQIYFDFEENRAYIGPYISKDT